MTPTTLKTIDPLAHKANSLAITDEQSMLEASHLLADMLTVSDRIETEKTKVMRPLLDAVNAERARWRPYESAIEPSIALLRSKISRYQTQSLQLVQETKDKIASRIGAGKGKLSLDTAITKAEAITRPAKIVGSISFRPSQTLKITDMTLIPREYLVPDESKLLTDLKKGIKITGATIEIVQIPVNKRQ